MDVTTIGFDIAKGVFQVHGVDGAGEVVLRRRLSRSQVLALFERLPRCLVGMEACGSAHHWARAVSALGHDVRLISPAYVKPYVKRSKTDAADAAAICEAVSRPHMRFVPIKSPDDQALALSYKTRSLLVAQRTAVVNALRAHLTEFGIIARQGPIGSAALVALIRDGDERLLELARETEPCGIIASGAEALHISGQCQQRPGGNRADAGDREQPLACLALLCDLGKLAINEGDLRLGGLDHIGDIAQALTPRQNSSGERVRIGRMSKAGNRDLRTLLVLGQMSVMRRARSNPPRTSAWVLGLMKRRPPLVVAVAMAAKTARIIWAMLSRGEEYRLQAA